VPEQSPNPLIKIRDAVWQPTPASLLRLALLNVIANVGIIVTGGAVRLTQSGLGCPTWPRCSGNSLVPTSHNDHAAINQAIEFGNRMFAYVVFAVAVLVAVAAWRIRPRRGDVFWLAVFQPFTIVLQAVMGGITVLTHLNPAAVSAHFLLSIGILGSAVALHVRAHEGDRPPVPQVRQELRWLGYALTAVVAALLLVGTIVTGSGPHAGDPKSPRYHFRIDEVAQLHADLVWITVGLTFALLLGLRLTASPTRVQKAALALLVIELSQGIIGYAQYWSNDPSILVGLHMFGASIVWIGTLRTVYAMRDRGPLLQEAPAQAAPSPAIA
jgi:cytochrome c oxidase assembly protein subunit 15